MPYEQTISDKYPISSVHFIAENLLHLPEILGIVLKKCKNFFVPARRFNKGI